LMGCINNLIPNVISLDLRHSRTDVFNSEEIQLLTDILAKSVNLKNLTIEYIFMEQILDDMILNGEVQNVISRLTSLQFATVDRQNDSYYYMRTDLEDGVDEDAGPVSTNFIGIFVVANIMMVIGSSHATFFSFAACH